MLLLFNNLLSSKTDVNVPTVKTKQNSQKIIVCWHHESHQRKYQDPDLDHYSSGTGTDPLSADPDPYQKVMDAEELCYLLVMVLKKIRRLYEVASMRTNWEEEWLE